MVIVENGTLTNERAVATELSSLSSAIADLGIHGPAVIFVGLDWTSAGLSRPDKVEVYGGQLARDGAAARAGAGTTAQHLR